MTDARDLALDRLLAAAGEDRAALLPLLHAIQAEFGWIDDPTVARVAAALNLSRADVHGVVTFYHDFRRAPPGRHVLKLCGAEACQAMGAASLIARAEARIATPMHSTRGDGAVTLEPVYCLGLCSVAPSAMLDGEVHGQLTEARLDALLDAAVA